MIRRTLINRARRHQRLARMLIARHQMIPHTLDWPRPAYRPAASIGDLAWRALAAAPQLATDDADALLEVAYVPEALTDDAPAYLGAAEIFPSTPALPADPAPDRPLDRPDAVDAQVAPSRQAAPASQPSALTLADLVRPMRDPSWVSPQPSVATQPPVSEESSGGDPIADLVRRMRASAQVPTQAPATPQSPAPGEASGGPIAGLGEQTHEPAQRLATNAGRPRVPLGRRMAEAADFGQAPVVSSPAESRSGVVSSAALPAAEAPESSPATLEAVEDRERLRAPSSTAEERQPAEVLPADPADVPQPIAAVASTGLPAPAVAADGESALASRAPAVALHDLSANPAAPPDHIQAAGAQLSPAQPASGVDRQVGQAAHIADPAADADLTARRSEGPRPAADITPAPRGDQPAAPSKKVAAPSIASIGAGADRPAVVPLSSQPTVGSAQADAGIGRQVGPEVPPAPAEAEVLAEPGPQTGASASDAAEAPATPAQSLSAGRQDSPRQPDTGLPQRGPVRQVEQLAQLSPEARLSSPAPATGSRSIAPLQQPAVKPAGLPPEMSERAQPAPDTGSPQAWAERMSQPQPENPSAPPAPRADSTPAKNDTPSLAMSKPYRSPSAAIGQAESASSQPAEEVADHGFEDFHRAPQIEPPERSGDISPGQAAGSSSFAQADDRRDIPQARSQPPATKDASDLGETLAAPALAEHTAGMGQDRLLSPSDSLIQTAPDHANMADMSRRDSLAQALPGDAMDVKATGEQAPTGAPIPARALQIDTRDLSPASHTPAPIESPSQPQQLQSARAAQMPARDMRDKPADPGSPQAWAARFARHRQAIEQPAPSEGPAAEGIQPPPSIESPAPGERVAPAAPGSPQAWAARFARHRQAIEQPARQPDSAAHTSQPPTAGEGPTSVEAPSAEHASRQSWARPASDHGSIPQTPETSRSGSHVRSEFDQVPSELAGAWPVQVASTPARFAPARRVDLDVAPVIAGVAKRRQIARLPVADATPPLAAWESRRRGETQAQDDAPPASGSPQVSAPAADATPPLAAWESGPGGEERRRHADPQAGLRHAAPTPIAETTRRLLRPLVGIDPAEARVFRGPAADQVASAYQAEALASGDMVVMSAQHGQDTPETLGVLAHELTHIARQRDPRFVPPLARRTSAPSAASVGEEALAQSVEQRVRRIAYDRAKAARGAPEPLALAPNSAGQGAAPVAGAAQAYPADRAPSSAAAHTAAPDARDPNWGGLPAPWEPLPEWLSMPLQAELSPPVVPQPADSAPTALPPAAIRNIAPAAPPVQLAETGRMVDALPAQSAPAAGPAHMPEPDLDALARQVYAVLKQRLAAERRRSQS